MSNETSTQHETRTRVAEPIDEDMTSTHHDQVEPEPGPTRAPSVIETIDMSVYYGDFRAVADVWRAPALVPQRLGADLVGVRAAREREEDALPAPRAALEDPLLEPR